MTRRAFHILIAMLLLACLISPLVEIAFHSQDCIFISGRDMESTLAVVLLVLALAFALARLLFVILPGILEKECRFISHRLPLSPPGLVTVIFEPYPLIPLRI